LERQIQRVAQCETVFGIGGGSACDAAKMFAWKTGAKLILVPSILSADAPFTKSIGVRVDHRVRYVGEVFPEHLLVDFELLRKAPPNLNRAGIGDILSIYTALFDWRLAHEQTAEAYDPDIAAQSQTLLDQLFAGADAIRENTEEGLALLSELYVGEVRLCEQFGNSRPEEGSEHYFGYCIEALTKRHFIHGELIAMAVVLTAMSQEQPLQPVLDFLAAIDLDFRPAQVGVTIDDIHDTLLALPQYLEEETQLPYGIYHHLGMAENRVDGLMTKFAEPAC